MITAGIDIGVDAVKVVIIKDGKVVSRSTASCGGGDRGASAEKTFQAALNSAGIKTADVGKIVATGQGKNDVHAAVQKVVEPVADAKGARYLYPAARAVVDVGADQIRLVAMDNAGKIEEAVLNQKCAAGIGVFLNSISRRMGISAGRDEPSDGQESGRGYS